MTSPRRQLLLTAAGLSDLALLALALYVAVFPQSALVPISVLAHRRVQVHTIAGVSLVLLLWRAAFSLMGLYKSKRLTPQLSEVAELLKASLVASLLLATVTLAFQIHTIKPAALVRFFPLSGCCLVVSRVATRQFLRFVRRRGRNLRHVLVLGTNSRALEFVDTILTRPELGYRFTGFVDDAWSGYRHSDDGPASLVSDLAGFAAYLRAHVVDEVIFALPIKSFYDQEQLLLHTCREQGVIVRVLTDLFSTSLPATHVQEVGIAPVVTFSPIPTDSLWLLIKRGIDVAGSLLLILLFCPVMLAAAAAVKLDSDGPAIFTQERIGLNKRRFRMYKFRSMIANAEKLQAELESRNEAQGPVFKIRRDPRITRVGRFIRKTSVDELPQLFNVLKGDMSLVGPRPLPVRDYTGFSADWQRRRFSVRPGITCIWQISGRSSISFEQWMQLDMQYIDHWSLWLDLKILARTIPAVLKGSGAA